MSQSKQKSESINGNEAKSVIQGMIDNLTNELSDEIEDFISQYK